MSHPERMAAVTSLRVLLTLADSRAASATIRMPFTPSGRQLEAAEGMVQFPSQP